MKGIKRTEIDLGHVYTVIDEEKLDFDPSKSIVSPPLPTKPIPQTNKSFLRPLHIYDSSEPMKEVSTSPECCIRILIKGVPVGMAIRDVGSSFETEMLTMDDGFEDITVDRTHGEAVITMKNTKAGSDLLQRAESGEKFFLQNNEVFVSPHQQGPNDPLLLYIVGLKDDTTTDHVSNYIEKICEKRPMDVIKGGRSEIALLRFERPPDVTHKQLKVGKLSPKESKFEVSPVERTRRIRIRDVALETTSEALKYHFENEQLSKGGVTESIMHRDHFKDYIITFARIEDAERVVQQEIHEIGNAKLQVTLHYPTLDRDEEYFLKIPGPQVFHNLNTDLCRFLQWSKRYKKDLEEIVKSHHGRVIWPDENHEEHLSMQCIVDENDILGRAKVEDWKQNLAGVVSGICTFLNVEYMDFALEILKDLKSKIKIIGVSDPQSVLVSFEENRIVIAGETKHVDDLSAKIKDLIISMEGDLDSREQSITKILKLKEHEIEMFKELDFQEQLKSVDLSLKEQTIVIKGRKKNVDEMILKTKDMTSCFPKQNVEGITMLESSLLRSKETKMYVKAKMKDSRVTGVWEISKAGQLVMYSKTSEELKSAVTILKSSLKSTTISVDSKIAKFLQQGDGRKTLAKLEQEFEGRACLKACGDEVCIVSVDDKHQEIYGKVMKFVDAHSNVAKVFPLDPGVFRYIFTYKTSAIDTIMQQYECMSVEIEIIDKQTRKGFLITGEKECCKLAIVDLQTVVNAVTRRDETFNRPQLSTFLRSPKGMNNLGQIELAEKCVIRISTAETKAITEKTRHSILAECKIGHCDIKIVQSDISEEAVEYIVNPTSSLLDHKSGLGRTLVDKGGFDIQKDCNDYIQRSHSLKDGDVFVGTAGFLPCQKIIHAVTPIWRDGTNNEESVLKNVVTKCLTEADKSHVASIAFPPTGAGQFCFPNEVIAKTMIKAIKDYLIDNGAETYLRNVSICDIGRTILPLLVQEIDQGFGRTQVKTKELLQMYPKESEKVGKVSKKITREIVSGLITAQDTDVIANPTNSNLDLRVGRISQTLVKEGGETISVELKNKYPNGVIAGEIAESSGGNLKCKAIFHGVLVKWSTDQEYAEMILKSFVRNCLLTSHKRKYTSIAFPVLGAGALEFPPDRVAEVMFDAIDTFEQDLAVSSLTTVRIIIHPNDERSSKAFKDFNSPFDKKRSSSRLSIKSYRHSCTVENVFTGSFGRDYTTTIGHVTLSIEQGDLTKATTAVIINSVTDDLNLETGHISRAILKEAGISIQSEANENKKSFKIAGLVMTNAGRLFCQKIIHVKAKNSPAKWKGAITKCLAEVEKSCLKSVSFPALGTGGKGISAAEMARTMMEAIQEYIVGDSYKKYIKEIKIFVYEKEMVEVFKKEVKVALGNSPRKSLFPGYKFWDRTPHKDDADCSKMVFHIYTDSSNDNTEHVVKRIEKLYEQVKQSMPESPVEK